jgi:hemolysin activation/secretion protein
MHILWKSLAISCFSTKILTCLIPKAEAQSTPPPQQKIPPSTPERIEETIPTPSESPPSLPRDLVPSVPQPRLQLPSLEQPNRNTLPTGERFFLKKVEVRGNTVLGNEISQLVKRYENKQVTFDDLIKLRSQITQLYIDNGYITSGAFLPNNQNLSDGLVEIQVVEGELESIEIGGLDRLREDYVRSRLELATDIPLKRQRLEKALQLLQLDPLIEKVDAELTIGTTPGRNILLVNLKEAPAFEAAIGIDNYRSPSIGSEQASIQIAYNNLFGFGDRIGASYGVTEGLNLYDFSYAIPVNSYNGTINFNVNNGDSRIAEAEFDEFNIESEIQTYSVGFRQPLVREPDSEFAIALDLDLRRSKTFLDEEPFSFTPGSENGESNVTVLRLSQDWVDRSRQTVLAFRSQFNIGLDAFDATTNNTETDGIFVSWLGQFQWLQQLSPRMLLLTRVYAQLTPDSLLSLEQFSLGGVDTVRGYRQNQLVTDNGVFGSIELRVPLTSDPNVLQVSPFFDVGTTWNNQELNPDPATIASLGLGLRWLITPDLSVRLDYGIPLIESNNEGDTLQDNGIYFSIQYRPFGQNP